MFPSREQLEPFLSDLSAQGWAMHDTLVPRSLWQALARQIIHYHSANELRPAGIGRREGLLQNSEIRGDSIRWLDRSSSSAEEEFLLFMDRLMEEFRCQLYVPVREYEAHFAIYPPGLGYSKHLDRFRDSDERELSTVLFLNADWTSADEGELLIFDPARPDEVLARIAPIAGRLLVFRSAQVPHQVQAPQRFRYSIAGWMRRLPSILT